jgi:hypothetical protein
MDIIGLLVGAVITLMIFSYLLGDNVLYRWALALIVGAAAGYALAVALRYVWSQWIQPGLLGGGDPLASLRYIIPLILGALLLLKGFPPTRFLGRIAVIGNISLAYLVGVGAAVAVAGALIGTLIPQVLATGDGLRLDQGLLGMVQGGVALIGTVVTLLYFSTRFKESKEGVPALLEAGIDRLGRFFIVVALGTAFAGAVTSALTALTLRLWQLSDLVNQVLALVGG